MRKLAEKRSIKAVKRWHNPCCVCSAGPSIGKAKVFYQGEIWDAARNEPITTGEEVEIVGFDDMKLLVRKV